MDRYRRSSPRCLSILMTRTSISVPPRKASRTEYGWRMQMIGDKCFITAVQPGSDAEAKGLKPGDEIYSWDGYEPTRDNLWKMQYSPPPVAAQAGGQGDDQT